VLPLRPRAARDVPRRHGQVASIASTPTRWEKSRSAAGLTSGLVAPRSTTPSRSPRPAQPAHFAHRRCRDRRRPARYRRADQRRHADHHASPANRQARGPAVGPRAPRRQAAVRRAASTPRGNPDPSCMTSLQPSRSTAITCWRERGAGDSPPSHRPGPRSQRPTPRSDTARRRCEGSLARGSISRVVWSTSRSTSSIRRQAQETAPRTSADRAPQLESDFLSLRRRRLPSRKPRRSRSRSRPSPRASRNVTHVTHGRVISPQARPETGSPLRKLPRNSSRERRSPSIPRRARPYRPPPPLLTPSPARRP
jgi:hypothetical protein